MIQKEISELRRRLTSDKNAISKIYGCYVNKNKEIISEFESSTALLPLSEAEKFYSLFKKTLGGTVGKNLIDIPFSTGDVSDSEKHKLLMTLKDSSLTDSEARKKLFDLIINSVFLPDRNYVILLAFDKYDVPYKNSSDDIMGEVFHAESESIFKYFICSICSVNDIKTELGYDPNKKEFHSCTSPHTIGTPEIGFMFPSFDDRTSNIYNALMFLKDASAMQDTFVDTLFGVQPPMSAKEQKNSFSSVLEQALEDECSFDVMQSVHEQIRERIEEHKESKSNEPLVIDSGEVATILRTSGVAEEKVELFKEKCAETFAESGVSLNPNNIIDAKKFEVHTPQIKISVDPDYSYAIETKVINGRKYILIPAEDGVKVNGIDVSFPDDQN